LQEKKTKNKNMEMNSTLLTSTQYFINDNITKLTAATVATATESSSSSTTSDALFLATPLVLMIKHSKTNDVSPVTLSSEWSRLARLLLLSILSVIGSIGNVFMISSVMIEDHLKKAGNSFIVNVALADLLITCFLIPASIIVILAGGTDSLSVCKFQWLLAACAFFFTILSLAVIIGIFLLIKFNASII
jgi:hypothetical protein